MNRGLIASAQSMTNAELRVGAIAANLANVSTPGYKRVRSSTERFELPGLRGNSVRAAIRSRSTTTFEQGALKITGRELDLALTGEGFFVLDGPDGELLTRNGVFLIDDSGVLVSEQGHPVAWESNEGALDPVFEVLVNSEGEVRQDDRVVGKLRLRAYEDQSRLEATGNGNFVAPYRLKEVAPDARVTQGALEGSNATAVDQLIDMIAAQRAYERSARVVSSISENYQRLTRPF